MTDDDYFAPYTIPDPETSPAIIGARLVQLEEHKHILDEELRIEYLMANDTVFKGNKTVIGTTHLPTVQGRLKSLFEMLLYQFFGGDIDFLITIDAVWWEAASQAQREIQVYHQLCTIKQEMDKNGELKFDRDGNPVFNVVAPDVQEFSMVAERYGAHSELLKDFLRLCNEGSAGDEVR